MILSVSRLYSIVFIGLTRNSTGSRLCNILLTTRRKQLRQRQGPGQTHRKHPQPGSSPACNTSLITGADNLIRLGAAVPREQKRTKTCPYSASLDNDIGYTSCFPKHRKSHPSRIATMYMCRIRACGAKWRHSAGWRLNGRRPGVLEAPFAISPCLLPYSR